MKLSLKRWFRRQIVDGPDLVEAPAPQSPRPVKRKMALITLAGILAIVGAVAGGADGLIDALEAAVGPRGTLLMNVGARDDHGWVNDRPEAERAAQRQRRASLQEMPS